MATSINQHQCSLSLSLSLSLSHGDEHQSAPVASRFPLPQGLKFSYGTAGFRAEASMLTSTVFRAGILAALRSLKTGAVIGLMITASHNPVNDNGVKIADPDGGMLTQQWEPFADALANAPDPKCLLDVVLKFIEEENIPLGGLNSAEILLGRDTRPSGHALSEAAKQGVSAVIGAVAFDMGILTTPQLHWMVRRRNKRMKASESDYFEQLARSFRCLVDLVPKEMAKLVDAKLVVDGANGVGGGKLEELKGMLTGLEIEVRNLGRKREGVLNENVGADHVQKEKVVPYGFGSGNVGIRCASLDGDADRLVYFRLLSANSSSVDLVDGDKILSLFAIFIKEQLDTISRMENDKLRNRLSSSLGIVQTAYANGASTHYLKQLGLEVVFTPTGVKYLHTKASEYNIGIYFEANGHGTILFSKDFISNLEDMEKELASCPEAILQYYGWSINRWSELYHDLPSKQLKVKVADRSAVVTANAETQVVKPLGLQELIYAETGKQLYYFQVTPLIPAMQL
ncbi:LOW QUALITY PROTEIN: phosphoacetylglucosamine mutase-like [Asparagus officinalis]|uniref:LOW QUALITY PROTEIN: phosphoacetylglucosamine mutase-like n=1 Tax=Asparagus officinalis TaxID=4686 RepID=UPI00098E7965|nr:LOW QUALITY PROTEIN: phosphoacetylglucosamine mutase-like [Asparagus officinalis]